MKCKLSILIIAAVTLSLVAKELTLTKQLEFSKATQKKTVVGTVKGFDSKRYKLKVKENQTLQVDLDSDNVYFNIYSPLKKREDGAIFTGKSQGKHFNAVLLKNGIYMIRVYLSQNEASEDIKRIFEMHINLK